MRNTSPSPQRTTVLVDAVTMRRANALVSCVGERRALSLLECGSATLDAARDRGRMRQTTLDHLRTRLDVVAPVSPTETP